MNKLVRTNSDNKNFIELVKHLDDYLAEKDGEEHAFYSQFNKINILKQVLIAYEDDKPVSCGAIKEFAPGIMEVKRMYTLPTARGKGMATIVLAELEKWAAALQNHKCVLETGKRQPEAIALYEKNGYHIIPNYGQYVGMENSVCFEKELSPRQ